MLAYKKYVTIKDPAKIILTDLPFRSGQKIEIVCIAEDNKQAESVKKLKSLFKKTQRLAQAKAISEDEIREEIEAYRASL